MLYAQAFDEFPPMADGPDIAIVLALLIFGFIWAIYWVANWQPAKASSDDEKTIREEIDKIFNSAKETAQTYNRAEFIPALEKARNDVSNLLEKKGVLHKKSA